MRFFTNFIFSLFNIVLISECYSSPEVYTRIFKIGTPIIEAGRAVVDNDLKDWFSDRGVNFPSGSKLKYANGNRHILSVNSENNQKLIEAILEIEKGLDRSLSKYSAFIEMCGSRPSIEVAKIMESEGWFSWSSTHGLAKEYINNPESPDYRNRFEASLSNFIIYISSELERFK